MADEEEKKIEKEIKEQRETDKSTLANVPPILSIGVIVATLAIVFFAHFTTSQWVMWLLAMLFILYIFSLRSAKKGPLTEKQAKALLRLYLQEKQMIGEIPPNNRFEILLVSSLEVIDNTQRWYYLPFLIIDENNIPRDWLAKMDNYELIGNTVYAKCPEGFWGTEKPTIKKILPESFVDLKKAGLDKLFFGKMVR